jgi:glycosyltransferase involved in cell wall biosynthesis
MQGPLVSIVTPSYNQGQFIRATIESVLAQDYPHIEYIIMDGGSTDETAAVARDYASRLIWISERDRGQSHAINKGFRLAKGEIVSWLNSDDVLLPGAVSRAVRAFQEDPSLRAVYGEGYLMDREGRITGRFPHTQPLNLWKLVHLSDYILQQTVFFCKAVFEEVGYLDEDLHYAMDWDILIRIAKQYGLGYIPEYMACLREYPEAKSFTGGAARVREIRAVLRRHTGLHYPPGYWVYGLDTYRDIWCRKIRCCTPSFLRRPSEKIQALLMRATGYLIYRVLRNSQGWFSDGWAGREAKVMLPAPRGRGLLIRGVLPRCPIREQELRVVVNGRELRREKFSAGRFEMRFALPGEFANGPLTISLRASRSFTPDGPLLARRRLSYLLEDVCLWEEAGRADTAARSAGASAGPDS